MLADDSRGELMLSMGEVAEMSRVTHEGEIKEMATCTTVVEVERDSWTPGTEDILSSWNDSNDLK